MISGGNALAPGPGSRGKAAFRWRPFIIRFERFTFFKPPALPEVYDLDERELAEEHNRPEAARRNPDIQKFKR
jgi:hypothetical protein